MAHLIAKLPDGDRQIELAEINRIGRNPKYRICFWDYTVSKDHALLIIDRNRECTIRDLASTNGTFVNGRQIEGVKTLYDGDQVKLGEIVCVYKADPDAASKMVDVAEEDQLLHAQSFESVPDRFLPAKDITDIQNLKADYEKLRVTHELQRDLRLDTDVRNILDMILQRSADFLNYEQGVILLENREGQMVPKSYINFKNEERLVISSTLVEHVKKEKTGIISTNIEDDNRFNVAESLRIQGVKSTIAVPIISGDDLLGVMILSSLAETHAFSEKDLGLISTIAAQAAQIIKNSLLHDELRLLLESSIRTLSATVDARHPLTAGHSEKVTEYAMFIGKEMGLSDGEMENLKFAAILHDIGKIGIRDKILLKNGRFSSQERAIMNTHPVKTRAILENFHFPKSLREVPRLAGQHHEKVNGKGYPGGLTGKELPVAAKILAVADVFDALTDRRDYPKYMADQQKSHDPLPILDVVEFIKEEAGAHFDKKVVAAFVQCLPRILAYSKGIHYHPQYVKDVIALSSGQQDDTSGN